ncbi:MAG: hypothetical protein AAGF11_42810 [Myxococcota bacterium]
MARGTDRFRRLRTPQTGDLFEHFGISADPPPPITDRPRPVIAAAACAHCGWLRPLPVRGACPLCGAPGRRSSGRPA